MVSSPALAPAVTSRRSYLLMSSNSCNSYTSKGGRRIAPLPRRAPLQRFSFPPTSLLQHAAVLVPEDRVDLEIASHDLPRARMRELKAQLDDANSAGMMVTFSASRSEWIEWRR